MAIKLAMIDHHLNNWHADVFLKLLRGPLAATGVKVVAAWESSPTGEDWCGKNRVPRAESPEAAVQAADVVMILAPDNIDCHLTLCQRVLPSGKPTYIDKYLADTLAEAKEITAAAQRYGAPIFSASGLYFAVEIEALAKKMPGADSAFSRGFGHLSAPYAIHTIAPMLRMMGPNFSRLRDVSLTDTRLIVLDYGGKDGLIEFRQGEGVGETLGWQFGFRSGSRYYTGRVVDHDGFYLNLIRQVAQFFTAGKKPYGLEVDLAAVAILDLAERSRAADGAWVESPHLEIAAGSR